MLLNLRSVSPSTLASLEWMLYNDLQNAPQGCWSDINAQLAQVRQELSARKLPPREPSVESEFAQMQMDCVDEERAPRDPWHPEWLNQQSR